MTPTRNSAATGAWSTFGLRPLSARSVVASVLMGTHPPELPTAALVRLCGELGIAEGTTRVALSRMVASGELAPAAGGGGGYRLVGEALLSRQRAQDEGHHPPRTPWDGTWRLLVVVSQARSAPERTAMRRSLSRARLAEWREGVWLRPANLPDPVEGLLSGGSYRWLIGRPDDDPVALAGELWPLTSWAQRARDLLSVTAAEPEPGAVFTFAAAAALLRHLREDPLLPPELLAPDWPGDPLRRAYDRFVGAVGRLLEWPRGQAGVS